MPILERPSESPPALHAIREVRVGMPRERAADYCRFYLDLLGLRAWPRVRQFPGGWGVGPLRRGLFFEHRHDPSIDPSRRRFLLVTSHLEGIQQRLAEAGWLFERLRGFFGDDCILMADPGGHRIEIRQARPI